MPLPICDGMAKRLILSLLAVLTGLFAQIAPAQAQPCAAGASEIGMVLGKVAEAEKAAVQAGPRPDLFVAGRPVAALLPASFGLAESAVLIGIDRARE